MLSSIYHMMQNNWTLLSPQLFITFPDMMIQLGTNYDGQKHFCLTCCKTCLRISHFVSGLCITHSAESCEESCQVHLQANGSAPREIAICEFQCGIQHMGYPKSNLLKERSPPVHPGSLQDSLDTYIGMLYTVTEMATSSCPWEGNCSWKSIPMSGTYLKGWVHAEYFSHSICCRSLISPNVYVIQTCNLLFKEHQSFCWSVITSV